MIGALRDAIGFLTVVPVPGARALDAGAAARAVVAFPVVGALVGLAAAVAGALAGWLWGPPLHAVAVVVAWAVVTGGMHLDGVADTCDAALSWRPRERKLEILRDSRIGAMGAVGLGLALLVQWAALASLGGRWWVGALAAPVWGRWAAVYGIGRFPRARGDGLGAGVAGAVTGRHLAAATLLAGLAAAALVASGHAGLEVAVAILPVWLVAEGLGRSLRNAFGGLTGDAYGALCIAAELVVLLWLGAWYRHPEIPRLAAELLRSV